VDGGYRFSRTTEVRIGQDFSWYTGRLRAGTELVPNYDHYTGVSALGFRYLGQDDAIVPRRGIRIDAKGEWYSSRPYNDSGFPSAEAKIFWFKPVSRPGSVFVSGAGGTAFGRDNLGLLAFSLGGIMRLGSYGKNELLGNQYFLLTAGYIHEIASLPSLFGGQIYAGSWYQLGRMYGQPGLPDHPMDISGGLVIKTLFGPVLLGGSWGDAGHRKLYFGLGAIF
jgi:NTE family protein